VWSRVLHTVVEPPVRRYIRPNCPGASCPWFVLGRSGVTTEISQGQEGLPEASLGCAVVQRWGEGGSEEAFRALRPGEPHAGFCCGEGLPDERVIDGVDMAGCAGAYRHEDVGFCGMNLVGEQSGRLIGYVGLLQADGLQAELEGLEGAGAGGLFEYEHHP
jgi:hypothetical protein